MDDEIKNEKGKQKNIYRQIAIIFAAALVTYIVVFILNEQNLLSGLLFNLEQLRIHMMEIVASITVALLGSIFFAIRQIQESSAEKRKRISAEETLRELKVNHEQTVALLQEATEEAVKHSAEEEERNSELITINRMAELVQTAGTTIEINSIAAATIRQLFPDYSGTLFLYTELHDMLDIAFTWGENAFTEQHIAPRECYVLQRGQPYIPTLSDEIHCNMTGNSGGNPYLCMPLIAQGDILGVFTMTTDKPDDKQRIETCAQLSHSICDIIAVSLSNTRLRESLRAMSIRDPLTGLFNRRYMDELLDIESRRSRRKGSSIGIIMVDIDHFKNFNDVFGHEVGDVVLKKLGKFVQEAIRDSDIACRYGGDEFAIIMPEASMEITSSRAEHLRTTVKTLAIKNDGHLLDAISLSLGVAAFPTHSSNINDVILAADSALYAAKRSGRDRVCLALSKE